MNIFLNSKILFFIFILAFLFGIGLIKYLRPILIKYFPDSPNKRSSHKSIKPRAGGIVFVLVTFIFTLIFNQDYLFSILICTLLGIVSLIDDKINLSSKIRYSAQLLVVILLFLNSNLYQVYLSFKYQDSFLLFLVSFFIVFISTGIINFINFMDGLDGLVSGCMLIIISTSFYLFELNWLLPLIGSLLAFLFWNWDPSKLFMGDVGSTFLGAIFVAIIFSTTDIEKILGIILVSSPLMLDAISCIARRILNKQNIFRAHKLHLYQRLNQSGIRHSTVSLIYISSTLLISVFMIFYGLIFAAFISFLIICLGFYFDRNIAIPFLIASRK